MYRNSSQGLRIPGRGTVVAEPQVGILHSFRAFGDGRDDCLNWILGPKADPVEEQPST